MVYCTTYNLQSLHQKAQTLQQETRNPAQDKL